MKTPPPAAAATTTAPAIIDFVSGRENEGEPAEVVMITEALS